MNLKDLENKFHNALVETNNLSEKKCRHNPKRIKIMMDEIGAVQTAKKLVAKNTSSTGYLKMAECGCLNITIEATMLRPEFAPLFTQVELDKARLKLPENIVHLINQAL